MDKCVGRLLHDLDSLGKADNTIVVFTGDNGTPAVIYSLYKGALMQGGKATTLESGWHVPLIVKCHRFGVDTSSLIDFTDWLPTFAEAAQVPLPTTFGTLDGTSFYPQINGGVKHFRQWIFCHYQSTPNTKTPSPIYRWVQFRGLKKYDSVGTARSGNLYNYLLRPNEDVNIHPPFTPFQQTMSNRADSIMRTMHN